MTLEVVHSTDPDINIFREQHRAHNGKMMLEHDEFYSEINYFKSMVSLTSKTITLPTGKKFHLRSIVISGGTKKNKLSLYSSAVTSTTLQLRIGVGSQGKPAGMISKTGMDGFCFTTYIKLVLGTSTATGTGVALGGILESQPDV